MDSEKRISRREVLRNVGIAGAVAWAAPVLSSLPAAEASTKKNLCKGLGSLCAGNYNPCSSCGPLGGGYCFDTKGKDNKPFCGENDYCSNLATCTKKCSKGSKCSWHNGCTSQICSTSGNGVCIAVCKKASSSGPRKAIRKGAKTLVKVH